MTFLAPGFLIAAGVAALAIVGLHFLSTREPKLELLPTTRFLPDMPMRATSTTVRPTDPWLLLLRILVVLLAGLALAKPVFTPAREPVARIVAADVSRAVGDVTELADSVSAYLDGAASVILFDATARETGNGPQAVRAVADSLRALAEEGGERRSSTGRSAAPAGPADSAEPAAAAGPASAAGVTPRIQDPPAGGAAPWRDRTSSRGLLSAALVAARRAAAQVRDRADSLELVIVSPFVREEYDAANERVRGLWPGRVTTVTVAAAVPAERRDSVRIEWADSVASAAAVAAAPAAPAADTSAASPGAGSAPSLVWTAREPADTVAALRAGDVVLVYPFPRRWGLAAAAADSARVIVRWADGEPAGVERPAGTAAAGADCVRSFGFALPAEGDALLRPEFRRFLDGLSAPCGEPRDFRPLPAHVMASLGGDGPLAAAAEIERRVERATPLMPWLLMLAGGLALLELLARRRGGRRGARAVQDAARGARSDAAGRAA